MVDIEQYSAGFKPSPLGSFCRLLQSICVAFLDEIHSHSKTFQHIITVYTRDPSLCMHHEFV